MDRTDRAIALGAAAALLVLSSALFAFYCWNWTLDHYAADTPAASPYGIRVAQERAGEQPYTHSIYVRYGFLPFGGWSRPMVEDCWKPRLRWQSARQLSVACTRRPGYLARISGSEPGLRIELDYVEDATEATKDDYAEAAAVRR